MNLELMAGSQGGRLDKPEKTCPSKEEEFGMPGQRNLMLNEDGSMLLIALMVFLVVSVLGTAVISAASLESKISHYVLNEQQSQQAADAGVDWAIEEIWAQGLPEQFQEPISIGEAINIEVEVTERENVVIDDGNGIPSAQKSECRYRLTSLADYHGVKKAVDVELLFLYSGANPARYDRVEIKSYKNY